MVFEYRKYPTKKANELAKNRDLEISKLSNFESKEMKEIRKMDEEKNHQFLKDWSEGKLEILNFNPLKRGYFNGELFELK